jgi:hypothetical protein
LLDGLEKKLAAATGRYHALMGRDVPAFNKLLAAKHQQLLVTALPKEDEEDGEEYGNEDFAEADADAD